MRLEDALLYLILDAPLGGAPEAFCAAAIAGGVDIIHVGGELASTRGPLLAIRDVCHRDDALLVVDDDAASAVAVEADGLHLSSSTASVGQARAMLARDAIVGMSTHSGSDAILALEMGVDYLLHWAGRAAPAAFGGLPGASGQTLFAAGLASLDEAQEVVEQGVYRLCIEAKLLIGPDVTEQTAAYSRILGRSI